MRVRCCLSKNTPWSHPTAYGFSSLATRHAFLFEVSSKPKESLDVTYNFILLYSMITHSFTQDSFITRTSPIDDDEFEEVAAARWPRVGQSNLIGLTNDPST